MLAAAGVLALAVALIAAVPQHLARAGWPLRAPGPALVLWQALGLAAGLLALECAATLALAPYGDDHLAALAALDRRPPWWAALAAVAGAVLLLRLSWVLLRALVSTAKARRRHREVVDVVSTRHPLLRGTRVLAAPAPVAYCLPGLLRPRVVVSQGALRALTAAELDAVLAHERAHLEQRHDLVVLPFTALRGTLPVGPVVTAAAAVALLVEVLADDRAVRRHDRLDLARALGKVGAALAPGPGAADVGVVVRARRLLEPPDPAPAGVRVAALAAAAAVALLPVAGLLLPVLGPGVGPGLGSVP